MYKIEFENKASASAPAQVVHVTQTLDADLDLSSFAFTGFGFGATRVDVPPGVNGTSFHTIYDATATLGVKVKIDAALNTQTRVLDVTYTSHDPATNDVPLDPFAGFLPPDDASGKGDGFLTYKVQPKAGLANGTNFTSIASIVFDTEAAIATPTVTNTLDTIVPTSAVIALPASTSRLKFPVRWTSADNAGGSGIAGTSLPFTDNGGPLQSALVASTDSAFLFTGAVGHTYRFFSQAIDNVGNTEALAATPDATITFVAPTLIPNKDPNGKLHVFTEEDGDTYTVALSGPGTLNAVVLDPDTDGKGPLDRLFLTGSMAKTKVTVAVKRAKDGPDADRLPDGDGIVTIGDLNVTGDLGGFTAKASDLTVDGVIASGFIGAVSVRDMIAADALAGVPAISGTGSALTKTKFSLTARNIADGTLINVGNPAASIKAASIGGGSITAPSLGLLTTSVGAMNADLAIAGTVGPINVKTGANAGLWMAASFKTVTLGATLDADIDSAGAIGPVTVKTGNLNGDLDASGKVASISVRAGGLTGQLTAASFGAVTVTGGGYTGLLTSSVPAGTLGKTPALARLTITGGDFTGDVSVLGSIGAITVKESKVFVGGGFSGDITARNVGAFTLGGGDFSGTLTSTTPAAALAKTAALSRVSITGGSLTGMIDVLGSIGPVSVKEDKTGAGGAISGDITARNVGAFTLVGGDFSGTLTSTTPAATLAKTAALSRVSITGGSLTGMIDVLGSIGPVSVKEDKTGTGGAFSGGIAARNVGAFTMVGGSFSGKLTSTTAAGTLVKTPALGGLSITGGNFTGEVSVLGSVGPVTVKEDKALLGGTLGGMITARNFGKVTVVGGNFSATLDATGTALALGKTPALAGLSVTGGDITGDVRLLGGAGAIGVKADKAGTGGNLVGMSLTAAKIAALTVGKNVTDSLILAGTVLGANDLPGGGDDTFAAGTIGAVNIGSKVGAVTFGNVVNSVIAAGLSNPDGIANNGDDTIFGATPAEQLTSKIAALIIKGSDITGSYFATGKFTAKPKVGGVTVDPTADARFKVA